MLTTDKIIAHKTSGKNLILLTQVESSYFLVLAQIVSGKSGKSIFSRKASKASLKTIFQKQVTQAEAFAIFTELSSRNDTAASADNKDATAMPASALLLSEQAASSTSSESEQIVLLLEGSVQADTAVAPEKTFKPVASPYFPTKDILLSTQMTCAPNAR